MNINDAIQTAVKFANQGMIGQAEKVCREIITANDKYHPAYHLLGQLAFQGGRVEIAMQMMHRATQLDGNKALYHRDFAEIVFFGGKPNDALAIIDRALRLNPNDPKSHFIAALALAAVGASDKAIEAYKTTIKLDPNFGAAFNNLGSLFENSNQPNEAKKAYIQAIKINKKNAIAQNNLGSILVAEGDVKGAKFHFEAAIKAQPTYIEAHHNLSALRRYKQSDDHFKQLEMIASDTSKLSLENQIQLYFILGKAYSDIEKYDKSFDYYILGNNKKRASFQYNEQAVVNFIEEIKTFFTKSYFNKSKKSKHDDLTAIFVVGMPRSGSSLIEQILGSHSDIHPGGELHSLQNIIKSKIKNFPKDIDKLSDKELKMIGHQYLENIKKLNPDAKRIVDKMPDNYHYAGLIAKILPGAHIINTNRNPLDSCFSSYTRLFIHTLQYAYDLGEIGRYYNRYQNLMDHWHHVLPKNRLLDVNYEDVVADLEQEARKLIDFVGLDWQENCLDFYKNKSRVNTASAAQVRQPIYKSSIEKWRPFEKHLGPLIETLAENGH